MAIDHPKPRRRWFRFSLRTLLIVVTLLSVVLGFVGWKFSETRAMQHRLQKMKDIEFRLH